jgi:hypothetical protein
MMILVRRIVLVVVKTVRPVDTSVVLEDSSLCFGFCIIERERMQLLLCNRLDIKIHTKKQSI